MNAWMNSSGHRANILKTSFNQIGVGYYNGVWVQEFIQSSMKAPSNPQPSPTPTPAPSPSYSQYYTVRSGDTFYKIAKNNWLTITQIKILNPNMNNYNSLYIGQKIRVRANVYTVKSGDIASSIAERNGMALWELQGLNPQDSNLNTLYVGQKLYVR